MNEKTVLAIDPGHSKAGMALVTREVDGSFRLLWRCISQRGELAQKIEEARAVCPFSLIVVGNGTRSKELISDLRDIAPGSSILLVEERNSTLEARARYWEHFPRRGLRRLIPASLQVPKEPLDDFAALVIAERALSN